MEGKEGRKCLVWESQGDRVWSTVLSIWVFPLKVQAPHEGWVHFEESWDKVQHPQNILAEMFLEIDGEQSDRGGKEAHQSILLCIM